MATFHINRGGTNLGTFSEHEVRDGLRSGKFFGTDLGWREGMATGQVACANFRIRAGNRAPRCRQPTAAIRWGSRCYYWGDPGSPPAPVCRGMTGSKKDFSPPLSKRCKDVLIRPVEAFTVMKREGGFGEPLIYASGWR